MKGTSLTNVIGSGARFGDRLSVSASGPQADDVLLALAQLADEGFGDGVAASAPPPRTAAAPSTATPATHLPPPTSGDILTGVPASTGLAFGPAHRLHATTAPPPDRAADDPPRERERLNHAVAAARTAIERDRDTVARRAGKADAAIFDAHLALLDDEAMLEPAQQAVDAGATAERAWYDAAQQVAGFYRALAEPLLQERAADVLDVGRRVVSALTGEPATATDTTGIGIAGELTPGDAATLDPALVTGIATAHGTATAHAAILARALGLPAVVGLGDAILRSPKARPCSSTARPARSRSTPRTTRSATLPTAGSAPTRRASARERAHEPGATRDGTRIEVFANLGSAKEAAKAVELGAEGVGLLRTEFLFLDRAELPTRTSRPRPCARSRSRSMGARSSCARSTPARTSRCQRCRCRPRPTRSSACAGSGSRSRDPRCS